MTEFKLARKFISLRNKQKIIVPITRYLEVRLYYNYIQPANCILSIGETLSFWDYTLINFDRLRKEFDQLDTISDFEE